MLCEVFASPSKHTRRRQYILLSATKQLEPPRTLPPVKLPNLNPIQVTREKMFLVSGFHAIHQCIASQYSLDSNDTSDSAASDTRTGISPAEFTRLVPAYTLYLPSITSPNPSIHLPPSTGSLASRKAPESHWPHTSTLRQGSHFTWTTGYLSEAQTVLRTR